MGEIFKFYSAIRVFVFSEKDAGDIFRIHCFGHWLPSQVHVEFSNHDFILPGDLPVRAQRFWEKRLIEHPAFFNGALCRLESYKDRPDSFVLHLSRTCYRDQIFCNEHTQEILQNYGEQALVRALGISVVIETADGFLPLMKRSEWLGEGAGLIDVFGGHVHPEEHSRDGVPEVFHAIADEIYTELALSSEECGEFVCIGLLENRQTRKPELVFETKLFLTMAELRRRAVRAEERVEYVEILEVSAPPTAVRQFLTQNATHFSPVGYGCLELFGRRRGWW